MPEHSVDRCFRLHGYPANFKGSKSKRIGAIVYGDEDDVDQGGGFEPAHLTTQQYHKMMTFVNNTSQAASTAPAAHLASGIDVVSSMRGSQYIWQVYAYYHA